MPVPVCLLCDIFGLDMALTLMEMYYEKTF